MRKISHLLLIVSTVLLFGCPKNDPDPQKDDDRVSIGGSISISFGRDMPNGVECGKPFEIKKVPFLIEKKSSDNNRCYYPDVDHSLRIGWGSEITVDLSKYKDIKYISLFAWYINQYGDNNGSEVILFDLNDKIISQKIIEKSDGGMHRIEFGDDGLSNIKKIVIKGWSEATDIQELFIGGTKLIN